MAASGQMRDKGVRVGPFMAQVLRQLPPTLRLAVKDRVVSGKVPARPFANASNEQLLAMIRTWMAQDRERGSGRR